LSFTVTGIFTEKNGLERVDMSWRSFATRDDFSIGNASVNRVFSSYLQQSFVQLAKTTPNPLLQQRIQLFINGHPRATSEASSQAKNLLLLNFSSLSLPLQSWGQTTGPGSTLVLQASTGFNVTLSNTFTESGETGTAITNAVYNLKARIETPAYSLLSGDQVSFETSAAAANYEIMLTIVFATLILLMSTLILEKRVQAHKRYPGKRVKG
jgi:hypothetical protein